MRFGLPESLGLPSFAFSFHVPMPGAYPTSPPRNGQRPSQAQVLRRHPSRAEQREARPRGPGPLELALRQIGAQLPRDDDETATPTPKAKRTKSKTPHSANETTLQHSRRKLQLRTVYIGNLPQSVTREDVHDRFSKAGKLRSWVVSCCRGYGGSADESAAFSQYSEGEYMATVEYVHASHAEKAVRKYHQTKWLDRTILVSLSPWDMPTGRRLRGVDLDKPPADANPRPTPYGQVRDTTVQRRDAALWRHTQDRRRQREEQVEQKRAERLRQQLGGASFPFTVT